MAKTITDCRFGTRVYLDEAAQADWLDTEVDMAVNLAYHDVVAKVMEVYEGFYETTSPFTYALVANQQEYVIDSSLIKVTRVEVNYQPSTPNSQSIRATAIKMDELKLNLQNQNTTGSYFSAGYFLHGNPGAQKIGFVPIPLESDTTGQSISVWGVALPTDMSNASTNVNIPYADRFYYLINLRAAALLLRKGQQEEASAARYMAEYAVGAQDLMTFLKERQADGPWMIEDSLIEDVDFSVTTII